MFAAKIEISIMSQFLTAYKFEGKNKKKFGKGLEKFKREVEELSVCVWGGELYNQFAVTEKGIFRIPIYCFY